ncbi:F390 synthetase-related protein [Luteolibacter sp. Populi]|uniref:F390 synthetase-related protein n=1 Tax=Luteolibacter sp. Populi TaxID=3230487 RepID=UPI00346652C7
MPSQLGILRHFAVARWQRRFATREQLLAWQERQLAEFIKSLASNSPFYRDFEPALEKLPRMNKSDFIANFAALNPHGITLEEATALAIKAERDRDFTPTLPNGITVGLSSGTSGARGVFLVSREDRERWAGIVLARVLSAESLRQILSPWRAPLKIAFFLRADSNLYRSLGSRRVQFRFFDLLQPLAKLARELQDYQPDVLVAPATVLAELARDKLVDLQPRQVVSVAEVLDEADAAAIARCFGTPPANVYQATEGFLASTCPAGNLHLNEEYLHVETEWLDDGKRRFHPVITDFSRRSQFIVRYCLDDVLSIADSPCPCGRVARTIRSVDGRADEVLRFGAPVFPDVLRHAFHTMEQPPGFYRIEQHGKLLHIMLKNPGETSEQGVSQALVRLFTKLQLPMPELRYLPWIDQAPGEKLRRIRLVTPHPDFP